jgi:3-hydroxyisobutyrate dehydrogenase-like beta-hydroxyacid dehydrogenase
MDAPVATRVAVVGLGKMGLAIAERILAAGFPLAVYNRTPGREADLVEGGATVLGSAAGGLRVADACVTMLADDAALEAVVLGPEGILAGARPGTTLIDMSTVSVAVSEKVAAAAETAGVSFLRAPVSGNPVVVRSGNLTIIVSGPQETAEALDDLLRAIGPTVFYVGDGERARVVKLVLQVLIGGTAELLAEGLVLGEAAGIDRAKLLEVISASAVGSPFVAYKTEPLLRGEYSATFTTTMMLKDVDLVLDLAEGAGLELPFTEHLRPLLEETAEAGYADSDLMTLLLRLEELARERAGERAG